MHFSQDRCLSHVQSFLIGGLVLASMSVSLQAFAAEPGSTQQWDTRFTVLTEFNNEAVRDNKTGLIWERSPRLDMYDWDRAHQRCLSNNTSGKNDWRVPTVQELKSLIDPSSTDVTLPKDHPFNNVEPAIYWSATKPQGNATYALFVNFSSGRSGTLEHYMSSFVWCVRGGMNDR
jgi:Protein of unknown function (DUF1566)